MANDIIKNRIQKSIKDFTKNDLTKSAINLFQTLGYNTDRQAPLAQKSFDEFKEDYIDHDKEFNEEKALCDEWTYVDLLFQLSKEEILKQSSLFDTKQVDNTVIETYLFFIIELCNKNYTRTALSNITREVNKLYPMPVMILFNHGKTLTLSLINRRLHKRDSTKDVLEKVTQIKDINIEKPHRAHIEILFDLSFDELQHRHGITNFVELHNAWQKTLNIQELNKRFFNELANWYFWATTQVVFPDDEIKDKDTRNATGVIRLITRLMFVWFLKEKNLVPDELFDERKLKSILKFSDKKNSTFYKAILQNLFFATLNTEMGNRKFRSKNQHNRDGHYFIHNVFRYEDEFIEPNKALETYFDSIPFLNGGLFECLDKRIEIKGKLKSIRIDGFSDRDDNVLTVNDDMFFGDEKTVDLTAFYDPKANRKKLYKVRGLIDILDSYKFTITENTPIEEEIALDPELLGKVFENLLANYNPETKTTARKQTGSFYTPREIVNYMVDESLIAYLKQEFEEESDTKKIRELLSYSENVPDITEDQKEKLIKAIDKVKILDPACGSGAFPMGVLHKLVHLLHKIDPKNQKWEQRQLKKVDKLIDDAEEITDIKTRKSIIADLMKNRGGIIEAFENNELDYGRKLFLIKNCIYGVDIQAIAAQISKLRFFISLIVDQRTNDKKENLGIRPLPNLETKFVAANTLIELDKENANLFTNPEIEIKKAELKKVRHKHFESRTPKTKEKCRQDDKRLRNELADILTKDNYLQPEEAKKLATWDPYDHNASAPFFDHEWMFGLNNGFDIVIGNPPYVEAKKLKYISKELKKLYATYSGTADLYVYFYENGIKNLNTNGTLVFITSNKFIKTNYGENLRNYFINFHINEIIDFTDVHVFEALVASCIFSISNKDFPNTEIKIAFADDSLTDFTSLRSFIDKNKFHLSQNNLSEKIWQLEDDKILSIKEKIERDTLTLKQTGTVNIFRGVTTGYNPAFIIDTPTKDALINSDIENKNIIFPLIQGRNIKKWKYKSSNEFIIFTRRGIDIRMYPTIEKYLQTYYEELKPRNHNDKQGRKPGAYEWYEIQDNTAYYKEFLKQKIVWGLTADKWAFAYDDENYFLPSNGYILTSSDLAIKFLLSLLNSRLLEFYFRFIGIMTAGGAYTLKYDTVIEFPIKSVDNDIQSMFVTLADYIICLNKQKVDSGYFERLLDAAVYELYLPEEIKSADAQIFKHLNNLPDINESSDLKNLKLIEKVQKELSDPKHPLSAALLKLLTIEEINIIEGRK